MGGLGQWSASWSLPLGPNADALPNYIAIYNKSDTTLTDAVAGFISSRSLISVAAPQSALIDSTADPEDAAYVPPALRGVLDAVAGAQTVIIERGYFDLDCRSEEAVAIMRQHRFTLVSHDRLHFFSKPVNKRVFYQAITDLDLQVKFQEAYLGYVVLRNTDPSTVVGRTMLAAPSTDARLVDPEGMASRVRTRVREHITLAGMAFHIDAVPFIQQDGGLTRCAHAATWMVHYSAVLRGYIGRRHVADMHPAISNGRSSSRPLPSPGLTTDQLMDALWSVGFTPDVRLINKLSVPDPTSWRHRPELTGAVADTWHLEAFTTSICRYLNSGLPVLLAVGDHVKLICGYLRNRELVPGKTTRLSGDASRVETFIVNDDSWGPYRIEHVSGLMGNREEQDMLIFPTPPALILSGHEAEVLGAAFIQKLLSELLSGKAINDDQRKSLDLLQTGLGKRQLGLRTYAAEGNLFKRSFAIRSAEDVVASRLVSACRLPRYVWICEIISRQLRDQGPTGDGRSVVGQVVIDASAIHPSKAEILVSHLPGWLGLRDQLHKIDADYPCEALVCESGRWGHRIDYLDDADVGIITKTAGAVT